MSSTRWSLFSSSLIIPSDDALTKKRELAKTANVRQKNPETSVTDRGEQKGNGASIETGKKEKAENRVQKLT